MTRPRVYISGPLTIGNVSANIAAARDAYARLATGGCAPWSAHLQHEATIGLGLTYEEFMEIDLAWLETADAVLRIEGTSAGADRECRRADELGIQVFTDVTTCICCMTTPEGAGEGEK